MGGQLPRAGTLRFLPGLGTVESRSMFRGIDRGFGGDSAGTERGGDEKVRPSET